MSGFFSEIYDFLYTLFNLIIAAFSNMRFIDYLDIIVMTFLIYKAIEFFRDTRAKQLLKGILVLVLVSAISVWFDFVTLKWLMIKVVNYGIIVLAVLFQPELRRALERVGRSRFGIFRFGASSKVDNDAILNCIHASCRAAVKMQEQKCGALMVFERTTLLGEIVSTGVKIDAEASIDLICNIFYPKSPLHDGGMILRDGRVYAAGCILPLAQNNNVIAQELGTRHRAAIGMSENSDAVVVVVSEENGVISLAVNGAIERGFNAITLRERLIQYLMSEDNQENRSFIDTAKGKIVEFKDTLVHKFDKKGKVASEKTEDKENENNNGKSDEEDKKA